MKTAKDVKRIVIAGAGTMGSSIGETFAKYGYDVTLYDIFPSALEKAGNLIRLNQETEVAEHVVTPEESAALLERIRYSEDKACFEGADLVVEAIWKSSMSSMLFGQRFRRWFRRTRSWRVIPQGCLLRPSRRL